VRRQTSGRQNRTRSTWIDHFKCDLTRRDHSDAARDATWWAPVAFPRRHPKLDRPHYGSDRNGQLGNRERGSEASTVAAAERRICEWRRFACQKPFWLKPVGLRPDRGIEMQGMQSDTHNLSLGAGDAADS
jgi:hypothetical protein